MVSPLKHESDLMTFSILLIVVYLIHLSSLLIKCNLMCSDKPEAWCIYLYQCYKAKIKHHSSFSQCISVCLTFKNFHKVRGLEILNTLESMCDDIIMTMSVLSLCNICSTACNGKQNNIFTNTHVCIHKCLLNMCTKCIHLYVYIYFLLLTCLLTY